MPASLEHIHAGTPMGANRIADGATFRTWAPNARAVHVVGEFNEDAPAEGNRLNPVGGGHWAGFVPGVKDRDRYMFYVVGEGSEGLKRDPYARELGQPFPAHCIVRETDFPWHEAAFPRRRSTSSSSTSCTWAPSTRRACPGAAPFWTWRSRCRTWRSWA